ncbi:MAG: ribonucleotide-diphosphate reductase subunit beta [Candidatus Campbellbacteria bacterium]|nr:ribonucleotide-diphosphate reductase subunit beta [Candidatus Campbellbacteria bacterium]
MQKTSITTIIKRDGSEEAFDLSKITAAISKAFDATDTGSAEEAKKVANTVYEKIATLCDHASADRDADERCNDGKPAVETIQDLVEESLMEHNYHEIAKRYILYRNERAKQREPDLFEKRTNLRPYEYPDLVEYVDAIRHSYWLHTEFNFTSDVQDFKVNVSDKERSAIKNAMLAVAQVEVAVKTFWGDIYKKMPKPEVGAVGYTFAESEVRHMDAYAHLLEILGLNDEFKRIKEIPAIHERLTYLEDILQRSRTNDNREYTEAILLFSLFTEHVSLFSQFLIIMSFNRHRNLFKGISNAVEATSKEEQIHGLFGSELINQIKREHPEWFDDEHKETIYQVCRDAYAAEEKIIDWIYEKGELDFLPAVTVKEFVKNRLNNSLERIGMERPFEVDEKRIEETDWFDDEVIATKHNDFFFKRSINYNKRSASVTSDDLF